MQRVGAYCPGKWARCCSSSSTSDLYFCCNSAIAAILVDNQRVVSGSKMAELQQIVKNALLDDVFE
jgi:hypothetical protein